MNANSKAVWEHIQDTSRPPFIAAEVGINHNGSMDLAIACIEAAADAGADAVKFQNFTTEEFLSDPKLSYTYESQGKTITESQIELFERVQLKRGQLDLLAEACRERGVLFFSTPSSLRGFEDLVRLGAPLVKNGSDFLDHHELIRAFARSYLPTVLSTGMATLAEIDGAVSAYQQAGGRHLVLLKCTSSYPTPAQDLNLAGLRTLGERYGVPVGFSDHSAGTQAAMLSTAMGSRFLEKHFTVDRDLPGPDHAFSCTPEELAQIVRESREVMVQLGNPALGPTREELGMRSLAKLSLVAARPLRAGHRLRPGDLVARRPGTGLPPYRAEEVLGQLLAGSLTTGEPLRDEHLAPQQGRESDA